MTDRNDRLADVQRRALFAAEVIVNRRLHDFSMRHRTQYSNDVAAERKAIEAELRALRHRAPAPPVIGDDLIASVAEAAALDADTVRTALLALASVRPDLLSATEAPKADADDEDE